MATSSTWWLSGFQIKEEHIWVRACPGLEGEIAVAGKAAVLSGELV